MKQSNLLEKLFAVGLVITSLSVGSALSSPSVLLPGATPIPTTAAVDPEALAEGNIPIELSEARLKEIILFFKNSKADLIRLRKEAKGFGIGEANEKYVILLQKIVSGSYRLTEGAQAEFLMRVALNQALALVAEYYVPGKASGYVQKNGVIKRASNPILKRVILEDSIDLAIQYFQEADESAAQTGGQDYDQLGKFAAERLSLASEWLDGIWEEGFRARLIQTLLEQWLQVVLMEENLKDLKFGNESRLIAESFAKLKLYPKDYGSQERILTETLNSVLASLRQNESLSGVVVSGSGGSSGLLIAGPAPEMNFVLVRGGTYKIGCINGSSNCAENEKPVHEVELSSFEMMTTEVTQGMWQAVMGENPSLFDQCGESCPVENVSWDDARTFAKAMNEKNDGYEYRLPTEAEWEVAARAGAETDYPSGDGLAALRQVGWYSGNADNETHPVAKKKPNAWGIYDMHGNVLEWVEDSYDEDFYKSSDAKRKDPVNRSDSPYRGLRGGSWSNDARYVRSSLRSGWKPGRRGSNVGFRLARTQK